MIGFVGRFPLVWFVMLALAGLCGVSSARADDTNGRLTGAGAVVEAPLETQWSQAFEAQAAVGVTFGYTASAIKAVTARTADFGATDVPLTAEQSAACGDCVLIPWALTSTAVVYRLHGVHGQLRLTGRILAGIYLGTITNWDDKSIAAVNTSIKLPNLPITAVHRTDPAGDTAAFAGYVDGSSTAAARRLGPSAGTVAWPGGVGEPNAAGVARELASKNGAIGYLDVGDARRLTVAAVRNGAGRYVLPNTRNVEAAAVTARPVTPNGVSIVNPPKGRPLAYPISEFTYAIAPTHSPKAPTVRQFFTFCTTVGQAYGLALGFPALPMWVRNGDTPLIATIT
jgi:phosphate transport system substrate-binding protein